ncbi:hypothetical protein H6A18_09510 [Collinsella tanakaei]|uniref:hypothetical protein n=1 Tax=Collinsella tanakaei TaxID=626935 RepID=UPI00195CABDC|nr:hypothetical protein [Collinsella tanakaei]MBM6756738.1 hypothetical protein [Collinsella tanakaei]
MEEKKELPDVLAWVEEHGGLDEVRRDFQDAYNRRTELCAALGIDLDTGWSDAMAELDSRLMPDGMKWPTVDGKPIDFVTGYEPSLGVLEAVSIYNNGACEVMGHDGIIKNVREIHVMTPKVLDAEGNRIEPAMDVWWVCEGDERGVHAEKLHVESIGEDGLVTCDPFNGGTWVELEPSELYVNKPVLDAGGVPIHEDDTVYEVEGTGHAYKVAGIRVGDGDPLTPTVVTCDVGDGTSEHFLPSQLTHTKPEPPDSWERIEEDLGDEMAKQQCGPISPELACKLAGEFVRRCRALAGDA